MPGDYGEYDEASWFGKNLATDMLAAGKGKELAAKSAGFRVKVEACENKVNRQCEEFSARRVRRSFCTVAGERDIAKSACVAELAVQEAIAQRAETLKRTKKRK